MRRTASCLPWLRRPSWRATRPYLLASFPLRPWGEERVGIRRARQQRAHWGTSIPHRVHHRRAPSGSCRSCSTRRSIQLSSETDVSTVRRGETIDVPLRMVSQFPYPGVNTFSTNSLTNFCNAGSPRAVPYWRDVESWIVVRVALGTYLGIVMVLVRPKRVQSHERLETEVVLKVLGRRTWAEISSKGK